ncbi:hypothetical protein KQJ29_36775, partial [Enterococcus sp. S181_ASV_20]|nr:hypothetical protein [Enterococcus sp. S181_ASV_20]
QNQLGRERQMCIRDMTKRIHEAFLFSYFLFLILWSDQNLGRDFFWRLIFQHPCPLNLRQRIVDNPSRLNLSLIHI